MYLLSSQNYISYVLPRVSHFGVKDGEYEGRFCLYVVREDPLGTFLQGGCQRTNILGFTQGYFPPWNKYP